MSGNWSSADVGPALGKTLRQRRRNTERADGDSDGTTDPEGVHLVETTIVRQGSELGATAGPGTGPGAATLTGSTYSVHYAVTSPVGGLGNVSGDWMVLMSGLH
jgi:hypothetical protein